ncbi:hypothetical protein EM858_05945 [Agrobacterium sp. CNPSo 2736]|nr:hypothetical protein EM858_05945 [Agrobacterium sp. CNPSo 2736]
MFFLPREFSVAGVRGQKAGNCGLFAGNRTRRRLDGRVEIPLGKPAAVDKFFVFVGKSPQNRAFAAIVLRGLPVFPDQNEEAYSFVVKPA